MKSREDVKRIEEICEELMEIIDASRTKCESDECELFYCVVHDSVVKMQRAVAQWRPEAAIEATSSRPEPGRGSGQTVN